MEFSRYDLLLVQVFTIMLNYKLISIKNMSESPFLRKISTLSLIYDCLPKKYRAGHHVVDYLLLTIKWDVPLPPLSSRAATV